MLSRHLPTSKVKLRQREPGRKNSHNQEVGEHHFCLLQNDSDESRWLPTASDHFKSFRSLFKDASDVFKSLQRILIQNGAVRDASLSVCLSDRFRLIDSFVHSLDPLVSGSRGSDGVYH